MHIPDSELSRHFNILNALIYVCIYCLHNCSFLHNLSYLNGRLMGPQLSLQPLVLLPQILHSSQITSIVLRTY